MRRDKWRDTSDWRSEGLTLSTTSDEASKLFDAALTQYVGWYEEDSFGGLDGTLYKMIAADPNFVMGHVMHVGLNLLATGTTIRLDEKLRQDLEHVNFLCGAQKGHLTQREVKHVSALQLWANGNMDKAANIWEDILVEFPTDMLALKMAHDTYFYVGFQPQMRDSIARVLPQWGKSTPLYSYLHGMYAFGLVETNFYSHAEKVARQGLEENPSDAWATHALAHVLEMEGRTKEGISFLSTTLKNWEYSHYFPTCEKPCGMLACHNFWHWALYHIEQGEYEAALDLFDTQVGKRCHSGAMLDIVDATSLLYRLELEGVTVGERWQDVYEICRPHVDDHILSFNDAHILMSCLGAHQEATTRALLDSLQEFIRNESSYCQSVGKNIGQKLCNAMVLFSEERYKEAVNLVYPIRYKILKIGGSNAQRDLFNIFLITAAIKSTCPSHHLLAKHLLCERKALKPCSPLTDRLIAKTLEVHQA